MSINEQLVDLGLMVASMVMGAVIGFEREMKSKPAGLRTHAFVAAASTLLIVVGPPLVELYGHEKPLEALRNEPLSMLHAIVLGVSFIGGGTIYKDSETRRVFNLTTATTLLAASTVGVLVGAHLFVLALGATLGFLLFNAGFLEIEKRLHLNDMGD